MTTVLVFVVLSLAISTVPFVAGGFEDSLKHWETLSMSSIKRRIVKRDTTSEHPVQQQINFDSFGRHFSLILQKDLSVLAPGLKILVFEANGESHEVHMDLNIYRGYVEGEVESSVSAYWNDDHALSASIHTDSELYFVEPAVNLNPNATNETLIVYRESDLRWDNNSRCGYVNDGRVELEPVTDQPLINKTQSSRSKRSACTNTAKNTCYLYLVAHPKFVKHVGRNDVKESALRMFTVVDGIDKIYRKSLFDGCDPGFGFEVKKVHIFPQATLGYPYTDDREFGYSEFLSVFTDSDKALDEVCLGHIFTYNPFYDDGFVLGLAYVGSPEPDSFGGICSTGDGRRNAGWTTYVGSRAVPSLQAMLVTAHEFGHNWGSPHDTESATGCTHPASEGGNYIVYPISVSGRDHNNQLFSPCSLLAMGRTLSSKAGCFSEQKVPICGNYRIDPGEECDSGFIISSDGDNCCDSNCKLRPGKACSDSNHLCCTDCQVRLAATGSPCYTSSDEDCLQDSMCNGKDKNCPKSAPKPDDTPCFNKGKCRNGTCQKLCIVHGFQSCNCDTVNDACKLCCLNAKGSCAPLFATGKYEFLPPGMGCMTGSCDDNGVCASIMRNPMVRLWEMLDLSTPSGFVRFMRNNIVWTILILSLLIWVPFSCCVCYADRKAQREREALIHEVVEEMVDDVDSDSDTHSQTSVEPMGRVAQQRDKMDDVKPGSTAPSPPPPPPPPPTPPSPVEPVGRHEHRHAKEKEEMKKTVRRLTLQMDPSEHQSGDGKNVEPVKSSMKRKVAHE